MEAGIEAELEHFVREWIRAMSEKDLEAAGRLRADGYRLLVADGDALDRSAELAVIERPTNRLTSVRLEGVSFDGAGAEARVRAEIRVIGVMDGTPLDSLYRYMFRCERRESGWVALEARAEEVADYLPRKAPPQQPSMLRRAAGAAGRRLRIGGRPAAYDPNFQNLAYLPYARGSDYVLEPHAAPAAADEPLPLPPEELWLGYDYTAHGEAHVKAMLDLVGRSGFVPGEGDRILDLGCGAGRMIRHLRHLADRCEIWGTDISARHITWCKHHLSPPFHFATNTKVPHLPFEDRSFGLIYCGSLFTHIDDLADAWLLELHRILKPGGRLFVTIHDEETVRLFNSPRYNHADIVRLIKASPTFQAAGENWGMFTIGRDNASQVFYKRAYFERMAASAFDTLSITTEAYHYQTAFVLARKDRPGQ